MNKQERINACLRLLNPAYHYKANVVKLNVHNSLRHEMAKCKKAYELILYGKEIYTEAIFKSGGRCDILIPEDLTIIEILETETEERFNSKKAIYPKELNIIAIRAEDV